MDSKGNAKISDFGLCERYVPNYEVEYEVGMEFYCAPESSDELNYSLDIWSLGICTYFMLTGVYPFLERKMANYDILPDLNEKRLLKDDKYLIRTTTCEFVAKLLKKNPIDRLAGPEIKNDPFYLSLNWDKLEMGELKPPIDPQVVINVIKL